MEAIVGAAALYLGQKVLSLAADKARSNLMEDVLHQQDKITVVLSNLNDISKKIDRNYKMSQEILFSQHADRYRDALKAGIPLVASWELYHDARNSPANKPKTNLELLDDITDKKTVANQLRQFQDGLYQEGIDMTPLKSAFTYFWLHYEDTKNNLHFGSADLMKGLYTVLDQIYSVQAAAICLLTVLDPSNETSFEHTRTQHIKQKEALFEELPNGILQEPSPPMDWDKSRKDLHNDLANYYTNLDVDIRYNSFYFRGVGQADLYLSCLYPDRVLFNDIGEACVDALNWDEVKRAANTQYQVRGSTPGRLWADQRTPGNTWEAVRWEFYSSGNPGLYHLSSLDRNKYARYEPQCHGRGNTWRRDLITVRGKGNLIMFKLILSRRAKGSTDKNITGKLVETDKDRYKEGVPEWCGEKPVTWSMAVPRSPQAKDDGWIWY